MIRLIFVLSLPIYVGCTTTIPAGFAWRCEDLCVDYGGPHAIGKTMGGKYCCECFDGQTFEVDPKLILNEKRPEIYDGGY